MAATDNDKEPAKEQQPLTPEERIDKLEKGRQINWIISGVLLLLVLAQAGGLIMLASSGPDPRVTEHGQRFKLIMNEVRLLESAYKSAEAYNDNAVRLEEKLDRITRTIQLNNFSAMRELMIEQEQGYQQFITTLQQGMYDISRMIKGSRSWYEVYKEDLDLIISDSRIRQGKLDSGLVAPLLGPKEKRSVYQ